MESLPAKQGFQMDMRIPRLDGISCEFANKWFGRGYVDHVMGKYHRSDATHSALLADLMGYDRKYTPGIVRSDPAYQAVLMSVKKDFTCPHKLIPLTMGATFEHQEFPKDKSPGLPWKELGFKTKGEVLRDENARGKMLRLWEAIGNGRQNVGLPDTCAFFRSQIATIDKNKIRAVWGLPLDVVVEEFRFFYPYMEWLKTTDAPIAYRVEMATGGMAYINEMCRQNPGCKYIMTDFQQFDKCVPPWLIRDAFRIVMDSMDMTKVQGSDDKIWNVNPVRSYRRVRQLIKYFINTPVRVVTGERWRKSGGIPSGSMFTNIIDTIVNCIISRYTIYHTTGYMPAAEMYLGDDSFIVAKGTLNISNMIQVAEESFGMKIHPDKSYVTENPGNIQFLGYFNRNGLPYKGNSYLVASFIFPERIITENKVRVSRAVGQMWSTLHSGMAYRWWLLVNDMLNTFGFTTSEIEEEIRSHPSRFRYLRMLGIPVKEIIIPETMNLLVPRVDPPWISLREYKKKTYDIDVLWSEALLLNWH